MLIIECIENVEMRDKVALVADLLECINIE